MVPTSTAEVKLQYEKLIIVFCFCQREQLCITCSLHQTTHSETTNPVSSKLAFLLKSGADFNSRSETAIRKKQEICFVFAKENIS